MSTESTITNIEDLFPDLDGGVFAQKIGRSLSDVALGVVLSGKPGKVTLTFDIKRIGESSQVEMAHKIAFVKPTEKGKSSEEDTTHTPLHVNRGGKLTLFPQEQTQFEFK
ncbi:MAG: hypothetical protein ACPGMR_03410 [Pontibacterium sp.]